VGVLTLGVLFPLPDRDGIEEMHAIPATAVTQIGSAVLQGQATANATERGGYIQMLAPAVAGLVAGDLVMTHLRLSGVLHHPPASRAEAVKLGLFLVIGVALSIVLAMTVKGSSAR